MSMPTTPDSSAHPARDGTRDFDFLHGAWRVRNRRLRHALSDANDWDEFDGTTVERPLWDGAANLEEYDAMAPSGQIRGLALRLYAPRARLWSIYWSNSVTGRLDQPMIGAFRDGRGEFRGQDEIEGTMVDVRFVWTASGSQACRWEQAFSADDGDNWEINWVMEFTRADLQ